MEASYDCPSHFKIVKLELDPLAFLQLIDRDAIQCVGTEENLVSRLGQDKTTAEFSQDLRDWPAHCLPQKNLTTAIPIVIRLRAERPHGAPL